MNKNKKHTNTHINKNTHTHTHVQSISKKIKMQFQDIVDSMQVQLRDKNKLKKEKIQIFQLEIKSLARKINEISSIIFQFQDNFQFTFLEDQPLIMVKYCQLIIDHLIQNYQSKIKNTKSSNPKEYNMNKIYEVVQAKNLQNHDLKQKITDLQLKLSLSIKRALTAEELTNRIKQSSQNMLQVYRKNFPIVCDLLKKAEQNEVEILQNNRFLNEQLQSLNIQFQRYKKNFKLGPNLKQKQNKFKNKLQREYQQKLKRTLKQEQLVLKNQLSKEIGQFFRQSHS